MVIKDGALAKPEDLNSGKTKQRYARKGKGSLIFLLRPKKLDVNTMCS